MWRIKMRALATIRAAGENFAIEGADLIQATRVDGWVCVTKKGEFNLGDNGVYFEIDSFLPGTDNRYSFLEKNFITWNSKLGARLRTMKLRGQISQGLFLPMSSFPELSNANVGDDVTEVLGIEKWEPPIPTQLAGEVTGKMRSVIPVTDEERIQNLVCEIATKIAGKTFEKTIKLDGTSMTVFNQNGESGVAGRNWEMRESEANTLWRVARKNKLIESLVALGKNIALRGELIGEGIQENNEKITGNEFYLFNIWDIDEGKYLSPEARDVLVTKLIDLGANIKQVPDEGFITFSENVTIDDILALADGKSLFAKNREGIVFKRIDGKFSFKAISNWYLLKHANR
jgi:RNA ligase (TIGR02306 family)